MRGRSKVGFVSGAVFVAFTTLAPAATAMTKTVGYPPYSPGIAVCPQGKVCPTEPLPCPMAWQWHGFLPVFEREQYCLDPRGVDDPERAAAIERQRAYLDGHAY